MSSVLDRIKVSDLGLNKKHGKDQLSKKILRRIKAEYRAILAKRCSNPLEARPQVLLLEVVNFLKEEFNIELNVMKLFLYRKVDFKILLYSFFPNKQLKELNILYRHPAFDGCKEPVIHLFNTELGFHLFAKPFFHIWDMALQELDLISYKGFTKYSQEIVAEMLRGDQLYEEVDLMDSPKPGQPKIDSLHLDPMFLEY